MRRPYVLEQSRSVRPADGELVKPWAAELVTPITTLMS